MYSVISDSLWGDFLGNYSDYLRASFEGKVAGDVFKICTQGKSLAITRSTLKNLDLAVIKTKKGSAHGELWVRIIRSY